MKYVSIDIETTGLDLENDDILSIGAVIEDTNNIVPIEQLPKIHIIVVRERIHTGSLFAINLNKQLIEWIVRWNNARNGEDRKNVKEEAKAIFVEEEYVVETLLNFLWKNGITPEKAQDDLSEKFKKYPDYVYTLRGDLITKFGKTFFNIAGKNFNGFDIHFLERLPKWKMAIGKRVRVLDPAICFVDWENDSSLPSLSMCKKRAGMEDDVVSHNAAEDAMDVISVLRTQYKK
jgi:DNA polymerase III epsilon subunit-like protein